jgi:hypothetical protein
MLTSTMILISIVIIIFAICLFYPNENFEGLSDNFARIPTDNGLLNKVIQQASLKTNPMSAQDYIQSERGTTNPYSVSSQLVEPRILPVIPHKVQYITNPGLQLVDMNQEKFTNFVNPHPSPNDIDNGNTAGTMQFSKVAYLANGKPRQFDMMEYPPIETRPMLVLP